MNIVKKVYCNEVMKIITNISISILKYEWVYVDII